LPLLVFQNHQFAAFGAIRVQFILVIRLGSVTGLVDSGDLVNELGKLIFQTILLSVRLRAKRHKVASAGLLA
jgi:hypothetical protein